MTREQRLAEIEAMLGYGPMAPDRAPRLYLALHGAAEYLFRLVRSMQAVVEAAAELRLWSVELDDSRMRYLAVQVDRNAMEEFDAALQAYRRVGE